MSQQHKVIIDGFSREWWRTYVDVILARWSHVGHSASVSWGQHDLVPDEGVFKHHAIDVSSCDVTANLIEITISVNSPIV